jgi:hypothetical protein
MVTLEDQILQQYIVGYTRDQIAETLRKERSELGAGNGEGIDHRQVMRGFPIHRQIWLED